MGYGLAEGDDLVTVFYTSTIEVDGVVGALEVDIGTAVLEGSCYVEDEGKKDVSMGVDISPAAVVADGGEALGEVEGLVEVERDDEASL